MQQLRNCYNYNDYYINATTKTTDYATTTTTASAY